MADYVTTGGASYYARNEQEAKLDNWIRDCCMSGSKSEMALYVQGQEILSLLRHIEDELQKK